MMFTLHGASFPPTIEGFLVGGLRISPNLLKIWWPGTELDRRRQPFQNCDFQCFQQLQGLRWDCQTLESTMMTREPWVIAVGDFGVGD
jgi:hypothetical protein